jgi:hypothetical protein
MSTSLSQNVGKRTSGKRLPDQTRSRMNCDLSSRAYVGGYWFNVDRYTAQIEIRFTDLRRPIVVGSVKGGIWKLDTRAQVSSVQLNQVIRWVQSDRVNAWIHGVYSDRSITREYVKPERWDAIAVPTSLPLKFSAHDAYKRRAAKR